MTTKIINQNEMAISALNSGIKLINLADTKQTQTNGYTDLKKIFDLTLCVYFLDSKSALQLMNDTAMQVCGFDSFKSAYGKTMSDIANPETAYQVMKSHQQTISTNRLNILEEDVFLKDGTQFTTMTVLRPWYADDNNVQGVFGCSILVGRKTLSTNLFQLAEFGILAPSQPSQPSSIKITPGTQIEGIYLSKRECDCLNLYVKGYSAKKIALILNISYRTVEHYLENIRFKLNAKNKAELIEKVYTEIK